MEIILKIDNFEGPLDLLLHLVEKNKMKISEIKISQLIDEYIQYIEKAKDNHLDIKVEFLQIASELLEIKALSVLNMGKEVEKEKEFKQRLEEYKVFKDIANVLSQMECEYNISYSRGESRKVIKKVSKEYNLETLKKEDIFEVYKKFLEKNIEGLEIVLEKKYFIEDEMENIKRFLKDTPTSINTVFFKAENRTHLVYMFLALLDLYRDGFILIENDMIQLV